ncbi:MAG: DUF3883 domain-containing protein [Nanoarchaeota archaeon]
MSKKDADWQDWSKKEWDIWILEKLNERKNVFKSSPKELLASYNREKEHMLGYEGRQLLELIQNANDARAESQKPNKMLLRLTESALFIANTGTPFSPDGVESLMISDASPKQLQRAPCIGYMGLGFRSVLGWVSSIYISSGKLSILFSEKEAITWLNHLMDEDLRIREMVAHLEKNGLPHPIATLSVPRSTDDREPIDTDHHKIIRELRNNGYDTVICLILNNSKETHRKIQEQIEQIGPEILLFLQHLEKIEIATDKTRVMWDAKRERDEVIINLKGKEPQRWTIFSDSDEIPLQYRRSENSRVSRYEIKLAICSGKTIAPRNLFVYFPTKVLFKYPLIAHATFELTDNRQNIVPGETNKFIAGRLAKLMAASAEKMVDVKDPWRAVLSITSQGDIDPVLSELGFEEMLKSEVSSRKILPVRRSKFECVGRAKSINGDFDDLLIGSDFKDICLYTSDSRIRKFLSNIGIERITYDDLVERLNALSKTNIPINSRAELISRIINNDIIPDGTHPPKLLIDENGMLIPSDANAMTPPEGKSFVLPDWAPQRIMNFELAKLLKEKFDLTSVTDLASRLEHFNVQAYRVGNIISSIVAETNRRIKKDPENELLFRQEMLQLIWTLYSSQSEKPSIPKILTILIPTRGTVFEPANSLYLGKEYPNGMLLEYLYGSLGGPFVGSPDKLKLKGNDVDIENFLCWLGVSKVPNSVELKNTQPEFLQYVIQKLTVPAMFEDTIINERDKIKLNTSSLRGIRGIDRLEHLLTTADPHAIIAWISRCYDRFTSCRCAGDLNAELHIKCYGMRLPRKLVNQNVPSYYLWLIQHKNWLPTSGGVKQSPSRCILAKNIPQEISALIGIPAIDLGHPLLKDMKLDKTAINNALATIGVVSEISELSWDSFYEILLELPKKDANGEIAKTAYRFLIGREDSGEPSGERYNKFMSEGKMWGKIGDTEGYFPISQLRYFGNSTLPESILNFFPVLLLDKPKVTAKVKKFFGVKPFKPMEARIAIKEQNEHPLNKDFQMEVDRLKHYIYALRVEADTNNFALNTLRKLEIKLCKSAKGSILVGDSEKEFTLQSGEAMAVDSMIYLVAEPKEYDTSFLKDAIISDSLGEVIANILKVDIGSNIARLAMCAPESRDALLNKIVGRSGNLLLQKAVDAFKLSSLSEDIVPTNSEPSQWTPHPLENTSTERTDYSMQTNELTRPDSIGSIQIKPGVSRMVDSFEICRRVKVNARSVGNVKGRLITNPDRAENLAVIVEHEFGRFAEKVSHLQGRDTYGCDVLSFKSEADAAKFKSHPDKTLVERFIEVKGSSNEKGAVVLKGNELICAQQNRDRYYIYRIYEGQSTGTFELVELQNPLEIEDGAIKHMYEIHPFKTKNSKFWDIEEAKNNTL